MKHVLFLESNPTLGIEAVRQVKEQLGYRVTFVTCDLAYHLKRKPLADSPLRFADRILEVACTDSFEAVMPHVEAVHREHPVTAVMSFFDLMVPVTAAIAERLGTKHLSLSAARLARDKGQARRAMSQAGVAQPRFAVATQLSDALPLIEEVGFPVVVKPVDGTASVNAFVVRDYAELAARIAEIVAAERYFLHAAAKGQALVEELVEGQLVSVETITVAGRHRVLGITDRIIAQGDHLVELGGSFPARPAGADAAIAMALRALDALGVDFGPTHTEVMLTARGPVLIEVNARLVGGFVPTMIDATLGGSILLDVVRLHLGEPIAERDRARGVASLRALCAPATGRLRRIKPSPGVDGPGVLLYRISARVGDRVREVHDNNDRLGSVAVWAPTETESKALAERLREETIIEVEP